MTQTLVPAKPTPLRLEEVVEALCTAWPTVITVPPTGASIGVATAQSAFETGNWSLDQKTLVPKTPPTFFNYNFGNERPGTGYDGLVTQYPCSETINGEAHRYAPPDPESTFRAFETAADGAASHLFFLSHLKRYAGAWARLLAGDASGYARALKMSGYFTGPLEPYERGVVAICSKVTPIATRILSGASHGITDEDREHVADAVALWLDSEARAQGEPFPLPEQA